MMHYYSHNIGDYAQATNHLSLIEDAVYTRLLRRYYAEETPIVDDLKQVCRWVGAKSEEERSAVPVVLTEFFELLDGFWHNKRAEEEIAAYRHKAETNRVNGKGGGRPPKKPKETQPVNSGLANETHPEPSRNLNQEPITNNQEPIDQHNTHNAGEANLVPGPEQKPTTEESSVVEPDPTRAKFALVQAEPEITQEPVDPLLPSEMSLEWEPDQGVLAAYAKVSMVPLDTFTPDATGAFVCHYSASGRFETQAKWVQLLVAWVKRDLVSGAARNNVRQFPVKRQVNGPDFNDTTWSDDLGDM
jgi:uncharacterized protein YdaU (DUF1376 family)